ncbi:MAG: patatin-like phospholipase family protein [Spirochaetia bacterium]|nr:patatin-like phospholipase family protein [Spirochaetia bacterium]
MERRFNHTGLRLLAWIPALALALSFLGGCRTIAWIIPHTGERTCLVLSVGGAKGMAHIGAIEALRAANVKIDCVYGNSMGAVIGGLYASAPDADLAERYKGLIDAYARRTQAEAGEKFLEDFVKGSKAASKMKGKDGLVFLLSGLLEGLTGTLLMKKYDIERFERTLNDYVKAMNIEDMPVRFATSYQEKRGQGLALVVADKGSLAAAVAHSANNPFIFQGTTMQYLDPGADRGAAVPVEEACAVFKADRLIVINVTGDKPFYSAQMKCPINEIKIEIADPDEEALSGTGPAFQQVRQSGFEAARAQIKTGKE